METGPTARVTVMMTLYNKGPFVGETVRSILESTLEDFDLLVVDDASTDGGVGIVKDFHDPRVHILRSTENTGRAAAANRGFDAAQGDYIAVVDADDIVEPERFAKQVAFLDAHPEVGICGSWLSSFGLGTQVLKVPGSDTEARALSLFGVPVYYPACMVRRSVLEEGRVRCDPEWRHPGMDYLVILKVGMHTRYTNLQEVLTRYRTGEQNMRHGRDPVKDSLLLVRRVFELLGVPATDEQVASHLFFFGLFPPPINAARVRALWAWKEDLKGWNRHSGLLPTEAFEIEIERRWDRLFFRFAERNAAAGMAHLRSSRKYPPDRLRYLMSEWARRLRARFRPGDR